ncbi:MAG: hypothetical protein ACAF41_34785 (plasmid) [Leptolyngbya sp. BL-A-14]
MSQSEPEPLGRQPTGTLNRLTFTVVQLLDTYLATGGLLLPTTLSTHCGVKIGHPVTEVAEGYLKSATSRSL